MPDHQTIGFIGAGNMATALIKGLLASGVADSTGLVAADKDEKALRRIGRDFGVRTCSCNTQAVSDSSVVVLAVKPQHVRGVLEEIREEMIPRRLLISIAAGIPVKTIQNIVGSRIPVIRVMPNTPALVQQGVSALAAGESCTSDHMAVAKRIFGAVGETVEVKEDLMDAVTALSGSGPGYIFRIMECMAGAGVRVGLPEETAYRLVVQSFLGAAYLAKTSDDSLEELRRKVTSPGGTTAAGLAVFDEKGLEDIITGAVRAAWTRSRDLAKE